MTVRAPMGRHYAAAATSRPAVYGTHHERVSLGLKPAILIAIEQCAGDKNVTCIACKATEASARIALMWPIAYGLAIARAISVTWRRSEPQHPPNTFNQGMRSESTRYC
jgi:hypothetical protein